MFAALPCRAMPCPALLCPALPGPALSWLVLPCPVLPGPFLPCLVFPCLVLLCPALPCSVLLWSALWWVCFCKQVDRGTKSSLQRKVANGSAVLFGSGGGGSLKCKVPKCQDIDVGEWITAGPHCHHMYLV
jgi:hypothetical protein